MVCFIELHLLYFGIVVYMYIVLIDKSCIDVDMFYLLTELVRIINREILFFFPVIAVFINKILINLFNVILFYFHVFIIYQLFFYYLS